MKKILFPSVVLLLAIAGCAQPERNVATAQAAPTGMLYDGIGKIGMHAGEPCTSQIMFDFKRAGASRPVWLAARMHETKLLTAAANSNRTVHVWGKWQRGKVKNCSYVSVTKVELF